MIYAISTELKKYSWERSPLKYNNQSFNLKNKICCRCGGNFFCFDDDGKLQILHIQDKYFLLKRNELHFSSFNALK